MVFTCSGCGSRYRIDDARIAGKSLRVVCKKCQQGHRIRDDGHGSFTIDILPTGQESESSSLSGLARPTRSMPPAPPVSPRPDRSDRPTEPEVPPPSPSAIRVPETWYALRKGVRMGPFDREGLYRMLVEGQILPSSFVWRPTMASWQRLEGVPDLADVVRRFLEGAKRPPKMAPGPGAAVDSPGSPPPPPSRTSPPPPMPQEESPPPLPPKAREPIRPSLHGMAEPTGGRLADDLFLDLSRPTIDLRRAAEVQPEEPEQRPRSRIRPRSAPAQSPTPPPPPASPAPSSHSSVSRSSDEIPLFPEPWIDSGTLRVPDGVLQSSPRNQVPSAPDPHMGVRDFSVMVRHLGRKDRRRNLTIAFVSGGVLLAIGGSLFAWIWLSGPKGGALPIEEASSHLPRYETPAPRPEPQRRELPRISLLESPAEPSQSSTPRSRPTVPEGSSGGAARVESSKRSAEPVPLPGPLDEQVQKDTARYGTLLARVDGVRRDENRPVDAPRTYETMPRSQMSQELMNEFLEKKHRRFEACRSQMKKPHDGPILVGISFEVTTTGQVQNVQVVSKNGIWDGNLIRCIREVILEWAFPAQPEPLYYQTSLML